MYACGSHAAFPGTMVCGVGLTIAMDTKGKGTRENDSIKGSYIDQRRKWRGEEEVVNAWEIWCVCVVPVGLWTV